jgi:hypothetical protein
MTKLSKSLVVCMLAVPASLISTSAVDAGLTGCGGYTSGITWNTSCNTANAGNPYPNNQQRARMTCSGSGGGANVYGLWKGVNVLSTATCGLTQSNKTYERR